MLLNKLEKYLFSHQLMVLLQQQHLVILWPSSYMSTWNHGAMMMAGFAAIAHDMNSSWTTIPKLGADNDDDNEDDQLIYNEFSSLWD